MCLGDAFDKTGLSKWMALKLADFALPVGEFFLLCVLFFMVTVFGTVLSPGACLAMTFQIIVDMESKLKVNISCRKSIALPW